MPLSAVESVQNAPHRILHLSDDAHEVRHTTRPASRSSG